MIGIAVGRRFTRKDKMLEHGLGTRFAASPPENYERYFVPAIGKPVATELLRVAALYPGERVR